MTATDHDLPPALARLPEEWAERLASWGEPRYRGGQVFRWIHQRGVFDPSAMTDLSKSLRERLREEAAGSVLMATSAIRRQMKTGATCSSRRFGSVKQHRSPDETQKLLLRLYDHRDIETVLIPQLRDRDPDHDDEPDDVLPGTGARVAGDPVHFKPSGLRDGLRVLCVWSGWD